MPLTNGLLDTEKIFYRVRSVGAFTVFKPADILEWTDDDQTALCPNCGIDSVIGDKSGYPVTDLDF